MKEIREGYLLKGTSSQRERILERHWIAIGETFLDSLPK
jgi:hypothetical protein